MNDVNKEIDRLTKERDQYRELAVMEIKRLETNLIEFRERIEAIDSQREDSVIGLSSEAPPY